MSETMIQNQATKVKTSSMVLIAVMAAVTCVAAPFSIPLPFTPVPISLTNLVIYITVFILGWKKGSVSYLVYLVLGMVGLPVFSGFTSGPAKLVGPTGGYLIGFLFTAIIAGVFVEAADKKKEKKAVFLFVCTIGMIIGLLVTYAFGTVWFMIQQDIPFELQTIGSTLMACVIPFLPGDAIKIVVALLIGIPLRKILKANDLID